MKNDLIKFLAICLSIGLFLSFTYGISSGKTDTEKLDDLDLKLKFVSDLVSVNELNVFGTEYNVGDEGIIFLQYLNEYGNPNNDTITECLLDVYYPNATLFLNQSVMLYLEDGIYYRRFIVPDDIGVYMISAECYVPLHFVTSGITTQFEDFESGNITGGIGWADEWDLEQAEIKSSPSTDCFDGTYCLEITGSYGYADRGFRVDQNTEYLNVSFYYKLGTLTSDEKPQHWIFDGFWSLLREWNSSDTQNIWIYQSEILEANDFYFGNMIFDIDMSETQNTNDRIFLDNITIVAYYPNITFGNETEYVVTRGSGELHVSDNGINDLWEYIVVQDANNLESNHDYCFDNMTLQKVLNYTTFINGEEIIVSKTEYLPCDYGCFKYFNTAESQGYCSPSPIEKDIPILIFVVFCFGIIIFAFRKQSE